MKKPRTCKRTVSLTASSFYLAWIGLNLLFSGDSIAAGSDLRPSSEPGAKGASKLLEWPRPERLPSDTDSCVLGPLAARWHQLGRERKSCETIRSNHALNLVLHHVRQNPEKPALVFIH